MARYCTGVTPRRLLKTILMRSVEPKPHSKATDFSGRSLRSNIERAASTRAR